MLETIPFTEAEGRGPVVLPGLLLGFLLRDFLPMLLLLAALLFGSVLGVYEDSRNGTSVRWLSLAANKDSGGTDSCEAGS